MPTYEYACSKCGHTFEAFQSMKAEPLKKCPKCQKNSLKRLVGAGAGLIFKGSGFYITDYKKSGGSATASSSSSESKSASSAKEKTSSPAKESKSTASGEGAKSSDTSTKSS